MPEIDETSKVKLDLAGNSSETECRPFRPTACSQVEQVIINLNE